MVKNTLAIFIFLGLFTSCNNKNEKSETSQTIDNRQAVIKNFDKDFYQLPEDSIGFITQLENLKSDYQVFFFGQQPNATWLKRRTNKPLQQFVDSLNKVFDGLSWEKELHESVDIYKKHIKNDVLPNIFVWNSAFEMNEGAWNYGNDIIIATDQYLGANHLYYDHLPMYIRKEKDPKYLVADILNAWMESRLITKATTEKKTLLDDMIFEGKKLFMTELMLSGKASDSFLMKTDETKMSWTKENEKDIWNFFISNDLLFSTDDDAKMRFMRQAPFSKFYLSFDQKSPGRIGEWVGLQIVKAYMTNTNSTVEDMMALQDAQKFLNDSKYKP
jgi:hypothetical protein